MSEESNLSVIEFDAQPVKAQTMSTDNTIRITLDLNEDKTMVLAQMAECIRFGVVLHITAIPLETNDGRKSTKRY